MVAVRLLVLLALLAVPLAAEAQPAGKVYRVGILSPGGVPDPSVATTPNLVPMVLRELGYVDASSLRVKLVVVEVRGTDYDRAFAAMAAGRADALFVLMSPTLTRDRKLIIDRAAKARLPAIYEWREQVEVGGLMSYGGSILDLSRRVAAYGTRSSKAPSLPTFRSSSPRSSSW